MACVCKRCEYQWDSKLEQPLQCPKCKSYAWNKQREWKKVKEQPIIKEESKVQGDYFI